MTDTALMIAAAAGAVTAVLTATFLVARLVRVMYKAFKTIVFGGAEMVRQWNGDENAPSMYDRINHIETRLDEQSARLDRINEQLRANGGDTLRDAVDRISRR